MKTLSPTRDNEITRWSRQLRLAPTTSTTATVRSLSAAIAALMATSSLIGLLAPDVYRDNTWSTAAFRGTDLATLVVGVPVLLVAAHHARAGADRATLVWAGALAYIAYDKAFYLFGTAFNDLFLVYAATTALAIAGLAWVTPRAFGAARVEPGGEARPVAVYLALVGTLFGALWVAQSIRYVATGDLPDVVVKSGIHTSIVFGLDLVFVVPALLTAAVLLWRRRPTGLVMGVALNTLAVLYMTGLACAGWFQSRADVAGASWAAPPYLEVGIASAVAGWLLLRRETGEP